LYEVSEVPHRKDNERLYGSAIVKAVEILEYLAEKSEPQGVSEIGRALDMNRATVYKLLETLQVVRFVEKLERDATYRLGLGLARLAHRALQQMDVVQAAQPALEWLNEQTQETVHLGVLDENVVVYAAKLESKQAVRMYSKLGNASPLYCTGIGKAILSTFDELALNRYLKAVELRRYTDHTITDREALKEELQRIRARGYAIDNCEHEPEVRCVAAPLYKQGVLYGAFSVSAPSYRMDDETIARYLPMVRQCQEMILARV
jgi:DNA-binding IclR family transcriptional regulator